MTYRLASCALLALACGGPPPPIDASTDAGLDAARPELDAGTDAGAERADGGPPLRVFFIGNSYTYVNDLPSVVREITRATGGTAIEAESHTPGGETFWGHASTPEVLDRIASGTFDIVVLQGQSLKGNGGGGKGSHTGARVLSDAARAAGARVIFYETWARREGDAIYGPEFGPPEMLARIENTYRFFAERNRDTIARVGAAFELARIEMPEVDLYDPDGSHPSAAGTLLAACVIAQSILDRAPEVPETAPLGVPRATAEALCALAPRVLCFEGTSYCDGYCTDTQTDPGHCGGCSAPCAGEDPCLAGECGCETEMLACDRACFDPMTDLLHCGACDNPCGTGTACEGGDCVCLPRSVQRVTREAISALDPGCTGWVDVGSADCLAGGNTYCAAQDCYASGYGPPGGHSPGIDAVLCFQEEPQTIAYADLAALVPACDGVSQTAGGDCMSAIHRYCVSTGASSGFGPVAVLGDELSIVCVADAVVSHTTLTELEEHATRCTPDALSCAVAAWAYCMDLGYAAGWGPIEVAGDEADVVCHTAADALSDAL
jgi:hypothetical protein